MHKDAAAGPDAHHSGSDDCFYRSIKCQREVMSFLLSVCSYDHYCYYRSEEPACPQTRLTLAARPKLQVDATLLEQYVTKPHLCAHLVLCR